MTVLFKVPPQATNEDVIRLRAKPYQHVMLQSGDRVFIWWSEGQGGHGLAGFGLCTTVTHQIDEVAADVEIVTVRRAGFGKADLRPFRDSPSMQPLATLSAKLYRHALNKVVAISAEEEALLDRLSGMLLHSQHDIASMPVAHHPVDTTTQIPG